MKEWMFPVAFFLVVLTLLGLHAGSIGPDVATTALEKQGFSEVRVVGKQILIVQFTGCGRDDTVRFRANGMNPAGQYVEDIYVCKGPFKKATVRF